MKMMIKKAKERKRQLRGQLDQIKKGMNVLKAEMEYVQKEVEALDQ
jgi:hypothetical protein